MTESPSNEMQPTIPVQLDCIPRALQQRDQWVCWKQEGRDGKLTKIPVDPTTGRFASTTDPDTWASLEQSVERQREPDVDGIGFAFANPHETDTQDYEALDDERQQSADDRRVFAEQGVLVGIDLDNCRDPNEPLDNLNAFEPWARDIIEHADTYVEVSTSGTGAHLIGYGEVPPGGNRSGDVEMYDDSRFFVVTGAHVDGTPTQVCDTQALVDSVHAEYILPSSDTDASDAGPHPEPSNTDDKRGGVDLDDGELLSRARRAENGTKFERLFDGDASGYESQSEADLALCGLLAFWTAGDPSRIDQLFRESGLMRSKWDKQHYGDGRTYGEATIEKAISGTSEYYDPEHSSNGTSEGTDPASESDQSAWETVKAFYASREGEDTKRAGARAADILLDEFEFATHGERDALYAYDPKLGIFVDRGERVIRERLNAAETLREVYDRTRANSIADIVRDRTLVDPESFDGPERHVCVANGVLDLTALDSTVNQPHRTAMLREHSPEYHFRQRLPVEYDPDATAPRWEQFIEESVEPEFADALQEYVGYTLLVGEYPYHRVLLLVGSGQNGKSTFLNTVRELLGPENVAAASLRDLAQNEFHRAELDGKFVNIDADVTGSLGDGGAFKRLTGGDAISASRKYEQPFHFRPTVKYLYSANEVPDTNIDDRAFFRRWLIVEFPNEFTEPHLDGPEQEPRLERSLVDELPGVLNWALEGLARVLDQGHFTNEGSVEERRQRWQSWSDSVGKFIAQCIETNGHDGEKVTSATVYEVYSTWVTDTLREEPVEQRVLTRKLKGLPGVQYSPSFRFGGKQERGFKGLGFTDAAPTSGV